MTHPALWRDMTQAQRAAYIRRTTLTTTAEKIKALKEAIKQKSTHENTPLGETKLTPEEQEAVLLGLEAEKDQGTGFDYIRERAPFNEAVPVDKRKHASILKSAERIREEKRRREEQQAAEREKANRKRTEAQKVYRDELLKNIKPKDQQGYSKKKTQEEVLREDLLLALPRSDVEHTQEPEEEEEEDNIKRTDAQKVYRDELLKNVKPKDQGQSKKKTKEDVLKDLGLWALPRTEVEHTQEPEEEEEEEDNIKRTEAQKAYRDELLKTVKPKDQGQSKKKTTEDVLRDFGLWALP